jgi:diguanylate cyclase (GGDEF)-like protein
MKVVWNLLSLALIAAATYLWCDYQSEAVRYFAIALGAITLVSFLFYDFRFVKGLNHLSHTDSLTGLLNLRAANSITRVTIKRAVRELTDTCAIFVDLNDFGTINKRLGHRFGDNALQIAGAILSESIRDVDSVFRIAGDEFAVLCPNTDLAGAQIVAERLDKALHFRVAKDCMVTAAVGVGCLQKDELSRDTNPANAAATLMDRANQAMRLKKPAKPTRRAKPRSLATPQPVVAESEAP